MRNTSSLRQPDAMKRLLFHTMFLAIAAVLPLLSQAVVVSGNEKQNDPCCCAAQPGRDGRDGRDGLPGPPGPPGKRAPGKEGEQAPKENSVNSNSSDKFYMLITPNDVKDQRYGERVRFYETPSVGAASIFINAGQTVHNRLTRVTLAEPNVLDDSAQYIVTTTIAHRSPLSVAADMDLYVTVSDGLSAVGYLLIDESNKNSLDVMWACEGRSEQVFRPRCTVFKSPQKTRFSPLHTVKIKVGGGRGAFGIGQTVSDVQLIATRQFASVLEPAKGIFLDLYREHAGERYIIDFIEVRLERETKW